MDIAAYGLLGVLAIGFALGTWDYFRGKRTESKAGWLYFIGGSQPDSPIKIGMSKNDPTAGRMPELQTLSPFPLKVMYKVEVADRYQAERDVHQHLEEFRLHGEWFERDAVLHFIDYLKEPA